MKVCVVFSDGNRHRVELCDAFHNEASKMITIEYPVPGGSSRLSFEVDPSRIKTHKEFGNILEGSHMIASLGDLGPEDL